MFCTKETDSKFSISPIFMSHIDVNQAYSGIAGDEV
jgi:hypothetical protein